MFQIFESNKKPNFLESLLGGLSQEVLPVLQQHYENEKQEKLLKEENEALGLPPQARNQKLREKLLDQQGISQKQIKSPEDAQASQENYNTVKSKFGKSAADIWKAATPGGQTELFKQFIDAKSRGIDLEDVLKDVSESSENISNKKIEPETDITQQKTAQLQNGKLPKDYQVKDYTKRPQGYTPKEWNDERKTWRKENAPIYDENKTKIKSIQRDLLDTKKLMEISKLKKLPEGFARLMINPQTGDFYGLAQLAQLPSPEAQEWVKIISRFQNRAKDAFGSRVTNFDLQSYMKQFPGLLNSPEGRSRILRMMDINYNLDKLYVDALEQVYQKYGLNGIPQEDADREAKSLIIDETERLENEYLGIDQKNQNTPQEENIPQEQGQNRQKVAEGTPLNDQIIDFYLEQSGNDPNKAMQMAQEDGYRW